MQYIRSESRCQKTSSVGNTFLHNIWNIEEFKSNCCTEDKFSKEYQQGKLSFSLAVLLLGLWMHTWLNKMTDGGNSQGRG